MTVAESNKSETCDACRFWKSDLCCVAVVTQPRMGVMPACEDKFQALTAPLVAAVFESADAVVRYVVKLAGWQARQSEEMNTLVGACQRLQTALDAAKDGNE